MIREVSFEQLPLCIKVINDGFLTVANMLNLTKDNCPYHPAFMPLSTLEERYKNGWKMYGLFQNKSSEIVGFMAVTTDGDEVTLHSLSVLPNYRNKGYGEALVSFGKSFACHCECSQIKIEVIKENVPLKEWYIKQDFCVDKEIKLAHLPFDMLEMSYKL